MKKVIFLLTTLFILGMAYPGTALAVLDNDNCRSIINSYVNIINSGGFTESNLNNYIAVIKKCDEAKANYINDVLEIATDGEERDGLNQALNNFKEVQAHYYDTLEKYKICKTSLNPLTVISECNNIDEIFGVAKQASLQAESSLNMISQQIIDNHRDTLTPDQLQKFNQIYKQNESQIEFNREKHQKIEDELTGKYCSLSPSSWGYCVISIIELIFWVINSVLGWILWAVGLVFNMAIEFSIIHFKELISSPGVMQIWSLLRDLANISFIFLLLYAGFRTIFQKLDGYLNPRTIVTQVIIFAVLVNFSAAITRAAIDLSNVPALLFYNQMATSPTTGEVNIANSLTMSSGLDKLSTENVNSQFNTDNLGGDNNFWQKLLSSITKGLLLMILNFSLIFVLAVAALNFLVRSFTLFFLVITSPIVFVSWVFPLKQIKKQADRWVSQLTGWCLYAPVFMGGIYLVLVLAQQYQNGGIAINTGIGGISVQIVWFGLMIYLLFMVDKLASDLKVEVPKQITGYQDKIRGYKQYWKKQPGRALNATAGRAYVKYANQAAKSLSDRTSAWVGSESTGRLAPLKNLVKRNVGWYASPTINNFSKSGFGTGESYGDRQKVRQSRHGAVMDKMSVAQKARYIQNLPYGQAEEAYGSLSEADKLAVGLAAQRQLGSDTNFADTNIGKARKKLKGADKDKLKEQTKKQMYEEMKEYAKTRTVMEDVVDENGQPVMETVTVNGVAITRQKQVEKKNEKGEIVTENVTDPKERYARMTEFLERQSEEDRSIIYEKMSNFDRAQIRLALEKLLDTTLNEAVSAEVKNYKAQHVTATDQEIERHETETRTKLKEQQEKARAQAKALDFEALNRDLEGDKRGDTEKEYKKAKRGDNKEKLEEIIKDLRETANQTTEAIQKNKDQVKELLKDFKGNYQDLGNLLTERPVLEQLDMTAIRDLRANKQGGLVDNIFSTIRSEVRNKPGHTEATPEKLAESLNMDPDMVEEALYQKMPNAKDQSGKKNPNQSQRRRGQSKPNTTPRPSPEDNQVSESEPQAVTEPPEPQSEPTTSNQNDQTPPPPPPPPPENSSVISEQPRPTTQPFSTPRINPQPRPTPVNPQSSNPKPASEQQKPNVSVGAEELKNTIGRESNPPTNPSQ